MPDSGLFKSINYFLALFKGFFLMNIYGTGCFQSREEQTLQLFFFPPHFSLARTKRKKLLEGIFFFLFRWRSPPDALFSRGSQQKGFGHTTLSPPPHPSWPCPVGCCATLTKTRGKKIESRAKSAQIPALKRWRRRGDGGCTRQPNSLWGWSGGDTVPHPSNCAALLSVMVCKCLKNN